MSIAVDNVFVIVFWAFNIITLILIGRHFIFFHPSLHPLFGFVCLIVQGTQSVQKGNWGASQNYAGPRFWTECFIDSIK